MSTPNASTGSLIRFRSRTGFERVFEVTSSGTKIGSRADADIRIGIPGIPPLACIIAHKDSELIVTEINTDAIQVDGQEVQEEQALHNGSILSIGPAQFTIELSCVP